MRLGGSTHGFVCFPQDAIAFLAESSLNDERESSNANQEHYEQSIRASARALIRAIAPGSSKISRHFRVELSHRDVHSTQLASDLTALFAAASPFMRSLCRAQGLSY